MPPRRPGAAQLQQAITTAGALTEQVETLGRVNQYPSPAAERSMATPKSDSITNQDEEIAATVVEVMLGRATHDAMT